MTTTSSEREDYRGAVCLNRACTDLRGARGGDAPELPAKAISLRYPAIIRIIDEKLKSYE